MLVVKLIRLSLIHTFGHDSRRPLMQTMLRLSLLGLAAVGFSWLFGHVVAEIPFKQTARLWLVGWWIFGAACGCATISYLGSAGLYSKRTDTFSRLLTTWPISTPVRWITIMVPRLLITAFSTTVIAVPSIVAGTGWGLKVWIIVSLLLAGYAIATGSLVVCSSLLQTVRIRRPAAALITLDFLGPGWWFGKKVWRGRGIRTSLAIALLLSTAAAGFAVYRHFADIAGLSLIAALLSASFCADIRGLSRRSNPAEIVALKGTMFFMRHSLLGALMGTVCVTLPLAIAALVGPSSTGPDLTTVILGILQVLAGWSAGVLAGTAFVPQARDISGQFLAVLLCVALLLLPSYAPYLRTLQPPYSLLTAGLLPAACITLACLIEYNRNPYNWRSHD